MDGPAPSLCAQMSRRIGQVRLAYSGGQTVVCRFLQSCELLLHAEGLGDIVEFPVAAVRSLEAPVDRDDAVGTWHFHLQVGVVRYYHEPSERDAPEDAVVL